MRLKGYTLEEVGKEFSLTRERVRQLLVENFGTSFSNNLEIEIRNLVMEYQWDSGNSLKEAAHITKKIIAIFNPMRVDPKDPLSSLVK